MDLARISWRTSTYSRPDGENCVEVGPVPGADAVAVRDTKNHAAGVHLVRGATFAALVDSVKHERLPRP